ncbi:MAG: hypothetical protein WCC37_09450 [Candidatus Sulfotelmatobacter sp.]|jgi:hypothetical protein
MNHKSKGIGLGIALGAALGVSLGVIAGHVALWLGLGVAIGMAIGSTLRSGRRECPECAAVHKAHSAQSDYKGDENGATFGAP